MRYDIKGKQQCEESTETFICLSNILATKYIFYSCYYPRKLSRNHSLAHTSCLAELVFLFVTNPPIKPQCVISKEHPRVY